MKSGRWGQIERLFEAALELEVEQRVAFLREACGGDEPLRREVESLLAQEQKAEDFMQAPALEVAARELARDQADSMVGRQIGSYRVGSLIGAGGMGEVYLAQDQTLDRKVALKFLPEKMRQDEIARKRFLREAKSAAALDHPYICKIYEIGEAEKAPYIAMEYVRGTTLDEGFSKGTPPLEKALKTALQIAEALEAAHRKGIVHRDLKPANIMLTSEGHVKVMDFGLAKRVALEDPEQEITALTEEGSTVGTVPYMSPQQLAGQPVDTRTDIFSFGILLSEMLTGVHPFKKARPMATANAILNEDPAPLSQHRNDVPPILQHTVTKMLAKDAGRRYQLVHEVHTDLVGVIRGLADPALPRSTSVLKPEPSQKSIALLWTVMLGVCAMIVGATAVWYFKPAATPVLDAVLFRWEIPLPEGERLGSEYRRGVALSPDGTQVAFVSGSEPQSVRMPKTRIYLHHLDQWQSRPIPGTEDVTQPFFSPDGNWLGFVTQREELKKVNLSGAEPVELCQCQASFGASWGPDDRIIFAADLCPLAGDRGAKAAPRGRLGRPLRAHRPSRLCPGRPAAGSSFRSGAAGSHGARSSGNRRDQPFHLHRQLTLGNRSGPVQLLYNGNACLRGRIG